MGMKRIAILVAFVAFAIICGGLCMLHPFPPVGIDSFLVSQPSRNGITGLDYVATHELLFSDSTGLIQRFDTRTAEHMPAGLPHGMKFSLAPDKRTLAIGMGKIWISNFKSHQLLYKRGQSLGMLAYSAENNVVAFEESYSKKIVLCSPGKATSHLDVDYPIVALTYAPNESVFYFADSYGTIFSLHLDSFKITASGPCAGVVWCRCYVYHSTTSGRRYAT